MIRRIGFFFGGFALVLAGAWLFLPQPKRDSVRTQVAAPERPPLQTQEASVEVKSPTPILQDAQRKLGILQDILKSKNDNDPRLDSEFRSLTAEDKAALIQHYKELPAEDRAGRGTIVYLIGRELTQPEDFTFLADVVSEKPCLSMANCSKEETSVDEATLHHDSVSSVSLAYPGLAAVQSIEHWIKTKSAENPALRPSAEQALQAARESQSGLVASHAARIPAGS